MDWWPRYCHVKSLSLKRGIPLDPHQQALLVKKPLLLARSFSAISRFHKFWKQTLATSFKIHFAYIFNRWRCSGIGVPPVLIHFNRPFPYKPSSYWSTPHLWNLPYFNSIIDIFSSLGSKLGNWPTLADPDGPRTSLSLASRAAALTAR